MDLAMPPMPFSTVFVPKQGEAHLYTPADMTNYGSNTRVDLPVGVVQVVVTWRGLDRLAVRHYTGPGSGDWETVALIPGSTSAESRSTGVLTLPSDKPHQLAIVIHPSSTSWNPTTLAEGYVAGVQVMPMGTPADATGGGSLLRVDDSVGTRVFLGDQMIYGDTGWRNIGANGTASWDFSGHGRYGIAMRRVNDRISVWVAGYFDQSTGTTLFTAPSGFRQTSPFAGWAYASVGMARVGDEFYSLGAFGNGRDYYLMRGAGIGTASLIQEFTWQTDDSWPSTLPGTAL